ncbi:DNA/RNA non-specific endonuclease [Polaribacter litorisediminis]|uniref:DNA/RNA non-specific endonuclease n=1 Tax=Polaribacter litorisediminis TaxID=1908341 RepID=UPI001CBCBB7D|nr:DNA/RNA non-specific endonuclease [Polaribacter litorisediminis]UAM99112.1 DNA/RNA non-specific endonuclease [Polaribacter litorisediminis]
MSAKKTMSFLIILLLFIDCRSKSAQAKLRSKNAEKNSSITTNKKKILLYPTSTTNQVITHSYLTLSYSEKDEQPEWVFYKISNKNYNKQVKRTNDYREDPFVKTESASPKDYKGSGYDMGHLAPAHAMAHNYNAMSESFYLSNISPQKASFNRGIWRSLESKVEYWSSFRDSIYVVTGPILDNPIDQIGDNKVNVPRAFYKTLVSFKDDKAMGIAFILPNEKSSKSIYTYATSIDEVERITNIDFYYNLDSLVQEKVEANRNIKNWLSVK